MDERPSDIDAMEADIRDRLKGLMARARKSKADAQTIFSKVKPMLRTAESLQEITEDRNDAVAGMAERASEGYAATGNTIRELNNAVHDDVLLQREQIAGLDETAAEHQATIHAPAEGLFQAVGDRKRALEKQVESVCRWLDVAEERWKAGAPRAARQQKAES